MGKVLQGALPGFLMEVVGVALLFTPLAPLGMTLITAGSNLLIAGAVAGALSYLIKKPSMDMQAAQNRLHLSINPQEPGKWVFGETAAATDIVYAEQHGAGANKGQITHIIAAAAHEIESFGNLYVNDELISFGGDKWATGAWANTLWRDTRTGTLTQDYIQQSGTNLSWPATADGKGIAHYALSWILGKPKTEQTLPTRITQIVKGAKVYDPRLDSTRGGSGAHRANDQTTWQYSNAGNDIGANWALVYVYYLLGWKINGELVVGKGVDPDDIDWASVIATANVCDQVVDSKPRYRVGGCIPLTGDHDAILTQLEAATGGVGAQVGGRWFLWAPHDDLTPTLTITDADLLISAGVEYTPSGPLEDLYNTARGRYISPADLYQPVEYPEVVESAAVTEDGRERTKDHDFAIIQDVEIAQRVARYLVRRSRFTGHWKAAMGPKGLLVRPFSVVTLNLPETDNEDVTARVVVPRYSVSGASALEFLEENASIYDTTAALGTPVTQLSPASYDPSAAFAVSGLSASATVLQGTGGTQPQDAISVGWSDPGGAVRHTEVRYQVVGMSSWTYLPAYQAAALGAIIVPVQPSVTYNVQARHISLSGVVGAWSSSVTAETGHAGAYMLSPALAWAFYDTDHSWTVSGATKANNPLYLRLTSTGADPQFISPAISMAGGNNTKVMVLAKRVSGSGWDGKIFYSTAGHGFSGSYYKSISIRPNNQLYTIIVCDMFQLDAGGTDWVDNIITGLRLDLGNSASDVFDIQAVAIGEHTSLLFADRIPYDAGVGPSVQAMRPNEAGSDNTLKHAAQGVDNPEYEAGDVGWTVESGTWSIVSDGNARRGSYAAKFTGSVAGTLSNNARLPVLDGETIIGRVSVKETAGAVDATAVLQFRLANDSVYSTASGIPISIGAAYTEVYVSAQVPAGVNVVSSSLAIAISPSGVSTAYVDACDQYVAPRYLRGIPIRLGDNGELRLWCGDAFSMYGQLDMDNGPLMLTAPDAYVGIDHASGMGNHYGADFAVIAPTDAAQTISGDGTGNAARLTLADYGSGRRLVLYYRGSDHASEADDSVLAATPNGANWHDYMRFLANTAADSTPGDVKFLGTVTKPAQPAFCAQRITTDQTDVAGNTSTPVTVVFNSEHFDQDSNYDTSTGIFTAPVDGKYLLTASVRITGITTACTQINLYIVTANQTYYYKWDAKTGEQPDDITLTNSVIAEMDAGDTAYVRIMNLGEASDVHDIKSGSGFTYFSGSLLN